MRIPALDGLRAVAVLLVIAFHSRVPGLDGGWLGVDVFFVLSGYLITTLLLLERERFGRISLSSFWVRRAARLYPALILLVVGFVALLLLGLTQTRPSAAWVSFLYLMDFARIDGTNYGILGHTWSLAIEEQFYLVWPLCLLLLRTTPRVMVASGLGAAASLAWCFHVAGASGEFTPRAYNAPDARAWELLLGCFLAAVLRWLTVERGHRIGRAAVVVAALTAVGGFVAATPLWWPSTPLTSAPGSATGPDDRWTDQWIGQSVAVAVATMGVLVVVLAGSSLRRALEIAPLPFVGRISYGAYLFHNPIVVVLATLLPTAPWLRFGVAVVVTLAVAWVSFALVEEPLRRWIVERWARRRGAPPAATPASLTRTT